MSPSQSTSSYLTSRQAMGLESSHLVEFNTPYQTGLLVHPGIIDDLKALLSQAEKDGLPLCLVSAFRSFDRQMQIWNDKWMGFKPVYSRHGRPLNIDPLSDMEKYKAISLWSALPGLSRHHWGSDLDIFLKAPIDAGYKVQLTPEEFGANGVCSELEQWLEENLESFGFFRPYRVYQQGVSQEPWHISHHQTARLILQNFDRLACRQVLGQSGIAASQFIHNQFDHYYQHYFCNLCEPKP